jgi:3-oxoacyl-[acyl-carrier protein] reductase
VIMTITATTARLTIPNVGGTGVFRCHREPLPTVGHRAGAPRRPRRLAPTTGIPEALQDTGGLVPDYGTESRMTAQERVAWMQGQTMLKRLTSLVDVGNMAAFIASDQAAAMTASAANITCGAVPD